MEKQKIYSWGDFGYKQDPQKVGEYIDKLTKKHNGITASILLSYAEDPKSPVHSLFTWDDTEAARRFRENEARHIIRSIKVTIKEYPVEKKNVTVMLKDQRAFPNIRKLGTQEGVYKPIENVINNNEDFIIYKNKAYQELTSCVAKYKNIEKLSAIMDKLQTTIDYLFEA